MKFVAYIFAFFSIFFLGATFNLQNPYIAHAQIPTSIDGIELSTTPDTAVSNSPFKIEVKSYSTNLSGADIVWYVNGKVAAKGTGQTTFTTTAPQSGKTANVLITIHTLEGRDVQKKVAISPNDVDLTWETDGYVPPLYRGKITNMYQNTLKVIAVPHFTRSDGTEINPKNLIYTWKKDATVLGDQSGYGRQSLSIPGAIVPRPYTVHVDVNSTDGKFTGNADLNFDLSKQFVRFYKEDPLYGVLYNTAIGDKLRLYQSEISVLAAPFGFNIGDTSSTNLVWSINGNEQPNLADKREVLFRVAPGTSGSSDITLSIKNQQSILQGADDAFSLLFDTSKSAPDVVNITNTFQ